MERIPIPSDPIHNKPQFMVLINESPWVYSHHIAKYDALHNASIVGGEVVPIDWVGNEMILPVTVPKAHR